jgi:hypothetical protein
MTLSGLGFSALTKGKLPGMAPDALAQTRDAGAAGAIAVEESPGSSYRSGIDRRSLP